MLPKVTLLYYNACRKYGIRPEISPVITGFTFKFASNLYIIRGCHLPINDCASASVSANKYCANKILLQAGIPVPNHDCISRDEPEMSREALSNLTYPLVVKPTWDTSCGTDVTCNIKDEKTLYEILDSMGDKYSCISVEEYQPGLRSYRALVLYGKVIGIVERIPAHVVGDGEHSVRQLMDIQNSEREKLINILPLGKLRIMPETEIIFNELGINSEYIPKKDETIPIRYICNSTFGGSIIGLDIKTICKENAELLGKAAKALNLNIVGFDFLCTDIKLPYNKTRGFIIEANASPDISIHENVVAGVSTPVSSIIIKKFIQKHFLGYLIHLAQGDLASIIIRFIVFITIALMGFRYYVMG